MKYLLIILTFLSCFAQDEWFFHNMQKGETVIDKDTPLPNHYFANSKFFQIDLTGDGIDDYFRVEMVDGIYYLRILDNNRSEAGRFKFQVHGHSARVYRVLKKNLGKGVVVTLFFFFEGKAGYLQKSNRGGLYALISRQGEKSHMKNKYEFRRLTSLWVEKKDTAENVFKRLYKVGARDIDGNGIRDVIVRSNYIKRVFNF